MREIKFRAIPENRYDEDVDSILDSIAFYTKGKGFDGTFVYGHLNGDYILGDTLDATEEYYNPSYWIKIDKDTIMQYTGLKDKNGKEIYEGDILKDTDNEIYYVDFIRGCFYLRTNYKSFPHLGWTEWLPMCEIDRLADPVDFEIVGNIYENPELLD